MFNIIIFFGKYDEFIPNNSKLQYGTYSDPEYIYTNHIGARLYNIVSYEHSSNYLSG